MTATGASAAVRPDAVSRMRMWGQRHLRPELQVVALAVALAAVSVGCYLLVTLADSPGEAIRPGGWWAFPVVAILFGVFEYTVFSVHFRHEGMSFSLSEVPTALALVFLPPPLALLARVPVSLLVLITARRNPYFKLVFNVSLFMLELTLAMTLFRWFVTGWGQGDLAVIGSVALALVIVAPAALVLIGVAISRFEGGFYERVVGELTATWWMYTVNAGIAAMSVSLAVVSPWLVLLGVSPLCGIWYVLWAHGQQDQHLRDLDAVHGFAGRVGKSLDLDEIGGTAVVEVTRLLRAQGTALIRFEDVEAAAVYVEGAMPLTLPKRIDEPAWRPLIFSPSARHLGVDELRAANIGGSMSGGIIVAPLRDESGLLGLLIVAERSEQAHRFNAADLARLENLGSQLTTSLRRGMLHERLEYEARHDPLTGLPARKLFERAVSAAVSTFDRETVSCVLMFDLDRFKEVNDTLGHHAGDDVLISFANRMGELIGPGDVLSRLAGDEFALLCQRPTMEEIAALANECVRVAGLPIMIDKLEIVVTVSVGASVLTRSDSDAIQPMRRADIAMYNAKWQRTGVEFYRDEIDRRTPARLSMLGDLRTAIKTNQLDVVYQPKLEISSGRIIGVEALVRWEHPVRGVVAPTEFVRVAEDTGLIKDLTDFVLGRGLAQMAELQRAGVLTTISVNLSTHDLFDARLPDRVNSYLEQYEIPPASLTLEITESSLFVDAPRTRATINGLRDLGLHMAVDDFGTGYSSLSYLRHLPVHELKIDQSFVTGMPDDPQDEVIVRSTVDLGHNLGLVVVAEGVESLDVLAQLAGMGCDVAQGYCISQPLLSTALLGWLVEAESARVERRPSPWAAAPLNT